MSTCLLVFDKRQRSWFERKRLDIQWYRVGNGGFYVAFLPYTAQWFDAQKENKKRRIAKKITYCLPKCVNKIFTEYKNILQDFLRELGYSEVDGESIFPMVSHRIVQKIKKNEGWESAQVGIYDVIFTNRSVDILEDVAMDCDNVIVLTGGLETAHLYANIIYEKTGLPICVTHEICDVDILFALDSIQKGNGICVDVCGSNMHWGKQRIGKLLFRLKGELEELMDLFQTEICQTHIEFLVLSDITVQMGVNCEFSGYKN